MVMRRRKRYRTLSSVLRHQPRFHTGKSSAFARKAAALRMAASSLRHSETALGAYYRHIARRIGGDVAGFATARKQGRIIYRLRRWGRPHADEGAQPYEKRDREN